MVHILLIDELNKLDVSKDSTLLFAHTLKARGRECYLVFEKDFYITSHGTPELDVYDFKSELVENDFYLKQFKLSESKRVRMGENIIFHMRLDPPFDTRYLKYLWMIKSLKNHGVKCLNDPESILLFNEKITPFDWVDPVESFVGASESGFRTFCHELRKKGHTHIILKPVDLYQGIGVEKFDLNDPHLMEKFFKKTKECEGSLMVQPFLESISEGELRTVLFNEKVIGTIKKVPKEGEFLANVAQGATYDVVELPRELEEKSVEIAKELSKYGAYWLAFDIIDGKIGEVNITCPGLIVEVSHAEKKNLADDIINEIDKIFS